jgi:succinylglutamate desuccinylase
LIAQIPTSTFGELGNWLVAMAGVLGIIALLLTCVTQARQLLSPKPKDRRPASERFVTRAEVEKTEMKILAEFAKAERSMVEKIDKAQAAMTSELGKHETYTHERMHSLANNVHVLTLKLAEQRVEMRQMIDSAMVPVNRKLDMLVKSVAALTVKAGLPIQDEADDS